jgi:hypothetical protein
VSSARLSPALGDIATGSVDKGDAVSCRAPAVTFGLGVWRESSTTDKNLTVGGDWALALALSGIGSSVPAVVASICKFPILSLFWWMLGLDAVVDVRRLQAASISNSVDGCGLKAGSEDDDNSCCITARRLALSITRRCV